MHGPAGEGERRTRRRNRSEPCTYQYLTQIRETSMSDGNFQDLPKPPGATMPLPALEGLSARIARWPWWAIIIMVGLVLAFYSLFTSDLYRAVLQSVTQ